MRSVFSSLLDPGTQQFDLRLGQFHPRFGRRHEIICACRVDAPPCLALRGIAWHNGCKPVMRCISSLFGVQPQFCFSFAFVWAVAFKTYVRKNGSDVAIVDHLRRNGPGIRGTRLQSGKYQQENANRFKSTSQGHLRMVIQVTSSANPVFASVHTFSKGIASTDDTEEELAAEGWSERRNSNPSGIRGQFPAKLA